MGNKMFSNKVVALLAVVFLAAILLDGRAYNRTPDRVGIYKLPPHPEIKIKKDNELLMAFSHQEGRWHLTTPFTAPVMQSRVEAILGTNTVALRNYRVEDINSEDVFHDAVSLEIGPHVYQIGRLEPVSQQRFVLANDIVYLQPDNVIPLLHAGQSAFVDLTLTNQVAEVAINEQSIDNIAPWSNLLSLGVIDPETIASDPVARIALTTDDNQQQNLNLHSFDGVAVLISSDEKYGYLLSAEQADALNLVDYL